MNAISKLIASMIGACLLLATPSGATTFNITGAGFLTGSIDIDITSGAVTGGSFRDIPEWGFETFGAPFTQFPIVGGSVSLTFLDQTSPSFMLYMQMLTILDPVTNRGTLVGYEGGTVFWMIGTSADGPITAYAHGQNQFDAPASITPLPAALPLFATGLGMMGLIAWRRKRKAVAAT